MIILYLTKVSNLCITHRFFYALTVLPAVGPTSRNVLPQGVYYRFHNNLFILLHFLYPYYVLPLSFL